MLNDTELQEATAQLADFRASSQRHHDTLEKLLAKYTALLGDYQHVVSDYEDARISREHYKQLARGQERNPFVLALVDGDGYIFEDNLLGGGIEGGQRAAALLNDTVRSSLRAHGLEHCRIMVRVYANLSGLSKALCRVKLAGPEKRSLAPFVASFNRSNDLFDFVDAGELKENADFKIRAMFRQFVDNAQCRQIYFACCHDVGYISELTPYANHRDKITLVRGPGFHTEFSKVGMRVEDFSDLFRMQPLDLTLPVLSSKSAFNAAKPDKASPSNNHTGTVCYFYQHGICKYGDTCRQLHVKSSTNSTRTGPSLSDIKDWRHKNGNATTTQVSSPVRSKSLPSDDANPTTIGPKQSHYDFATKLPQTDIPRTTGIPLNMNAHRLDPYTAAPSRADKAAFTTRTAELKLCNHHQIGGHCAQGSACPYDHKPISPALLAALKYYARSVPCQRRGECRDLACPLGHICQKPDCMCRGGSVGCRFPVAAHSRSRRWSTCLVIGRKRPKERREE